MLSFICPILNDKDEDNSSLPRLHYLSFSRALSLIVVPPVNTASTSSSSSVFPFQLITTVEINLLFHSKTY